MNIDWALLREQKEDLLSVIHLLQSESDESAQKQADSLIGILHLIDSIQDEAVDSGEFTEKEVFGNVKDEYENGVCPDCQEEIPDGAIEGSDCENCGHVFSYSKQEEA